MSRSRHLRLAIAAVALAAAAGTAGAQDADRLARLGALEARLGALEREISLLEDVKAIKRLQRAYGYYLDEGLGPDMAELFADDATAEYGAGGVYVGKARIREYLTRLVGEDLPDGRLFNHMILQGVVHVADDGRTAKGRWRALIQTGEHGESASWAEGPYENEYVKENGVWKFSKVHWYQTVSAPYEPGWHLAPEPMSGPLEDFPPDRPPSEEYASYPSAYLVPYHYANPVSGRCEPASCDAAE